MSIVAFYSMKGGVGKTAASVNVAHAAAQSGKHVLLCDLDPQGATSFYFRIKASKSLKSKTLLKSSSKIDREIKGTDYANLDLLPAAFSYRNLDLVFDGKKKSKKQLAAALKPFTDAYDIIFLDCPPSMSLISENVFAAADVILVPMIPTTLSMLTASKLTRFFKAEGYDTSKLHLFCSMVEKSKRMHREIQEQMREDHFPIFMTSIPYAAVVEKMGTHRQPVVCFSRQSQAAKAYAGLWQEVAELLP